EETNREEVVGERRRESASRENPVTPANSPTINKAGEQHRNNTTHSPAQVGEANREKAGEKRRETVATPANSPATTSPTSPAPAPWRWPGRSWSGRAGRPVAGVWQR